MSPRHHRAILIAATTTAVAALTAGTALSRRRTLSRGPHDHGQPVRHPRRRRGQHDLAADRRRQARQERLSHGRHPRRPRRTPRRGRGLPADHEPRAAQQEQGTVRGHGQQGAFDSSWTIDRRTLAVKSGEDLIKPGVTYWNYPAAQRAPRRPPEARTRASPVTCSRSRTTVSRASARARSARRGSSTTGARAATTARSTSQTRRTATRSGLRRHDRRRRAAAPASRPVLVGEHDRRHANRSDTRSSPARRTPPTGQLWVYVGTKHEHGQRFQARRAH